MIKEIINKNDFMINTRNLKLVPVTINDAPLYFKEFSPEITEYQISAPFENIESAKKLIKEFNNYKAEGIHLILTILNKNNVFTGSLEIYNLNTKTPEIGLWICKKYQRKGYAFESILGLVNFLKNNSLLYDGIYYEADIRNISSIKLAEKLGAVKESFHIEKNDLGVELKLNKYIIKF